MLTAILPLTVLVLVVGMLGWKGLVIVAFAVILVATFVIGTGILTDNI